MPQIKHIESNRLIEVSETPVLKGGIWECGNQRFTDLTGTEYEAVIETPIITPPKVSPVQFKLLFTSQERVAIKAARTTDAILDDFYDIIDDPRLTEVDLALQSVQNALDYLTALTLIGAGRKAEILLGVVQ